MLGQHPALRFRLEPKLGDNLEELSAFAVHGYFCRRAKPRKLQMQITLSRRN